MKKLLLRWVLLALSVVAASLLTQMLGLGFRVDVSSAEQVFRLFVGVGILALANATLGRLAKFLTIPLSCLTLGLFSLIVNAVVLWAVARLKIGFDITGKGIVAEFLAAFVGSLLISAINGVLRAFLPEDQSKDD